MNMPIRALLAAAVVFGFAACDSGSPSEDAAPTPMPSSAFKFDNSFSSNLTDGGVVASEKQAGLNYFNAAVRVVFINVAVGANLVLPSGLTDIATRSQPTVVDGTWIWNGSGRVGDWNVNTRLEGTPDGSDVDWELFFSGTNTSTGESHSDFRVYTATSNFAGTEGSWSLFYDIEGSSTNVLNASYTATTETDRELEFSVPQSNPDPDARGASVTYRVDGSDRVVDFQEAQQSRRHVIFWVEGVGSGYLEAWNWNEGQRACWNASQDDTACNPS